MLFKTGTGFADTLVMCNEIFHKYFLKETFTETAKY